MIFLTLALAILNRSASCNNARNLILARRRAIERRYLLARARALGSAGRVRLGPGRGGGDCREGCLIARWFAGTAPGATWVVDGDAYVGVGYTMLACGGKC